MSEPKAKLDISDLKDTFLECPICVEHFNQTDRRPRLLHSCLHAFCTPCLQKLLEKEGQGQITCPFCRRIQKVEDNAESLPSDPLRSKLVEYVDVQKKKTVLCSECSEQRDAISRCQDCQTYLCKECDFIHKRHRSTRDHSPISVQEALGQPIKSLSKGHFCPKHPKHHFEFYCTSDEHLFCISCTVVDHKGHDLQNIEEAAASRIADIETSLASARGQADNLRESKKICKRNEKHIQNDMASTLSDINTVFDDLQTRLDRRRKMLIGSVKEKANALLSSVHKESEALDETLAVIESIDTYFSQAKDKADVVEVLQIYPAMKRSLTNVQDAPPVTSSKDFEKLTFVKPTKDSIDVFVSGFDARSVGHGRVLSSPSTATVKVNGGGARSKQRMRSPNKPYLVTADLFIAVKYILTLETLKQFCEVESEDDHMAIYFLMDTTGEASRIKQRMMGIIQEVISVSSSEASKAESVARAVMEEDGEVYIKYDKNRQVLTLFAEEWDKISKAKNRIQAKFGSSKASSRGARRFGPQTADKTSDDPSTSSPTTTSGPSHAPGVSSIPGTAAGKNITVRVYKANIVQLKVDVIVNGANGYLSHGAGVARAIAAAAGDGMTREGNEIVRQRGDIGVTDLAVTSAGKLPYKNIFHAVGPAWRDYKDKTACLEDVCRTVLRCLCEARKQNISSIAIPAITDGISSSMCQVPQDLCAKMYIRAVKSFDQTVNGGPRIDVHFVDISDKMVDIISKELDTNWSRPLGQDELDRDAAFIRRCLGAKSVTSVTTPNSGDSSTKPVYPLPTGLQHLQSQTSTAAPLTPGDDPCSICLDTVTDPVKLKCGDVFCMSCIDKAFAVKKVCPNCKAVCGIITGSMPSGTMTTRTDYRSLPGYSDCNTIVIQYQFMNGKQTGSHPNPGKPYKGATRTAYLPDNLEGHKVLALLKIAWNRKLTFTVGTSVTINDGQDRVTWNEIHHKTERTGGPINHGYPDAGYLKRVTEELAAQGVTEDDLGGSSSPM